ncbi:MAG: peptidylprolyl isomerase, partial [Desulfobacterales bacterium]
MNSNKIRLAGKVAVALALILVSAVGFAADKKAPGDRVAVVNGTIITRGEFDRVLDSELRRAAQSGQQIPGAQMAKIENSILDRLIVGELLFQESKKKGIQVKPETVTEQLMTIKQRFPSEAEFKKALEENNMTESKISADIKRDVAIQRLLDKEVDQKVKITDEESKTFYDKNLQLFQQPERVKASHILIKVDEGAPEEKKAEARKKIKEIQQKVQNGEDFAALAKTYSEGPSGPKGGDLGSFGRGQMVKPFEDAAFSLKPNETSDIVETRFGYHLIKVVEKQPAKKIAYADAKDRINK